MDSVSVGGMPRFAWRAAWLLALAGCAAPPPSAEEAPRTAARDEVAEDRPVPPPTLPGLPGMRLPSLPVIADSAAPQPAPAPPPVQAIAMAEPPAAPAAASAPDPVPALVLPTPLPDPEPAAVVATAEPASPPTATGPGRVPIRVQLVAAGSEAEAMRLWSTLTRRAPELTSDRQPLLQPIERQGARTMWRLRVGEFATAADARAYCARLRDRGQACWVSG